jgi:hypothetical protein
MKTKRVLASCIGLMLLLTTACGNSCTSTSVISSTFNPAALEQWIGTENSVQMTFGEYEKTAPAVWNELTRTFITPLPIVFRNNRIPTLHISRVYQLGSISTSPNSINIDGLEQRDAIFSPFDGDIALFEGDKDLAGFNLYIKDTNGNNIARLSFATTGLDLAIDIDQAIMGDDGFRHMTVKKETIIGYLLKSDKHSAFNGQVQVSGTAFDLNKYGFATTPEGKLIEIIK